jgi:hypothetical protein
LSLAVRIIINDPIVADDRTIASNRIVTDNRNFPNDPITAENPIVDSISIIIGFPMQTRIIISTTRLNYIQTSTREIQLELGIG